MVDDYKIDKVDEKKQTRDCRDDDIGGNDQVSIQVFFLCGIITYPRQELK